MLKKFKLGLLTLSALGLLAACGTMDMDDDPMDEPTVEDPADAPADEDDGAGGGGANEDSQE